MKHLCVYAVILLGTLLTLPAFAQQEATDDLSETVCTFQDGKEISLRYNPIPFEKKTEIPRGKVWAPGDEPMYLFSQTDLVIDSKSVPPGAYSVYVIPNDKQWTFIINKGVQKGAPYDEQQDVARQPMETGQLPSPATHMTAYFGHEAPQQCVLRLDYGKTRAYTTLQEKQ